MEQPQRGRMAGTASLGTKNGHKVMTLVARGKSSKAIAKALGISIRTLEAHRASIARKVKQDSSLDLMLQALASS